VRGVCRRAPPTGTGYLVALLLVLAIGSEALTIELRACACPARSSRWCWRWRCSDPLPAAAIGCVSVLADDLARAAHAARHAVERDDVVAFPLAGGWIIRLATGSGVRGSDALGFAALVGSSTC
jgi:hypothetical protein